MCIEWNTHNRGEEEEEVYRGLGEGHNRGEEEEEEEEVGGWEKGGTFSRLVSRPRARLHSCLRLVTGHPLLHTSLASGCRPRPITANRNTDCANIDDITQDHSHSILYSITRHIPLLAFSI